MIKTSSKNLIYILVASTIISCGSNQQSVVTQNPHLTEHQKMHDEFINQEVNQEMADEIEGTYIGTIPCADCDGIIYELELNNDYTYKTTLTFKGKSNTPIVNEGKFSFTKEYLIELDANAGNMNYFKKLDDGILLLDKNGMVIQGDLANNYKFMPKKEVSENMENIGMQKILMIKQAEGIDFYAIGNEPSWSLDIDFDKFIHLKSMNGIDFIAPAVAPVMAQDHNVKRYLSVTESGEIIVQIIQGECIDNMSGQKFSYQVTVDYKSSKETDYTSFNACGMYVPDFRLHDIWAIEEVNGIIINPLDYKKNAPNLEINVNEQRAFGSDGCNTFRGKVHNEENKLFFGPLASTMMACMENEEVTNKINAVFAIQGLTYTIENNKLTLSNKGDKIMVLKHID